jgi:hypothetical protein
MILAGIDKFGGMTCGVPHYGAEMWGVRSTKTERLDVREVRLDQRSGRAAAQAEKRGEISNWKFEI